MIFWCLGKSQPNNMFFSRCLIFQCLTFLAVSKEGLQWNLVHTSDKNTVIACDRVRLILIKYYFVHTECNLNWKVSSLPSLCKMGVAKTHIIMAEIGAESSWEWYRKSLIFCGEFISILLMYCNRNMLPWYSHRKYNVSPEYT